MNRLRVLAAGLLAAGALVVAVPAAEAHVPRIRTVEKSTCTVDGSCATYSRRCLRVAGERFCTRWRLEGTWVR